MAETWDQMVARRSKEPGAPEAYEAARLAYELGEKVRKEREKRGWSQRELADAAGMQQPQVARFEAGGTIPKIATLQRLVTALDGHIFLSFSGSDRPRRSSAVVKRAAPAIGQRAAGAKRSASSAKKVTAKRGAQVKA